MSRRIAVFGPVLGMVALAAFALGWFYGPAKGLGAMPMAAMGQWMHPSGSYGMHPGMMPGGWMGLGWGGVLSMGLFWVAAWALPVALIAALVIWLLRLPTPPNPGQ